MNIPDFIVHSNRSEPFRSISEVIYRQKLGDEYQSRLCLQVYRLEELNDLFSASSSMPKVLHIECQLWIKSASSLVTR